MNSFFRKIRNSFITGIAVAFPLFFTGLLIWYLFSKINIWFLNPAVKYLSAYMWSWWVVYAAKGLVLILIFFFFYLIGIAARTLILMRLFKLFEIVLFRLPLIGRIYKAIKQISNAFIGEGKTVFHKVLLLEYPRKGLYSIGFLTNKGKQTILQDMKKNILTVFVPTTPNPTSGVFLLVPEEEAVILDMTVEEGLKLVISGGTVYPKGNKGIIK